MFFPQYLFYLGLNNFRDNKRKECDRMLSCAYISELVKIRKCKFYPSFVSEQKWTQEVIMSICLSTFQF